MFTRFSEFFKTVIIFNIPKSIIFLLALFLIFYLLQNFYFKNIFKNKIIRVLALIIIIVIGLYYRLVFAWFLSGNSDLRSWERIATWAVSHKNIYNDTGLYGYFPPWAIILYILKKISILLPQISPQPIFYVVVRVFLTLIDLLSLYILFLLSKVYKISFLKIAPSFFINPVVVIITGYHGQFEGVAVLFILLGLYIYKKSKNFLFSYLAFSFGGIIKHNLFNQIVFFLKHQFKSKIKILVFFCLSLFLAAATLLPFINNGIFIIQKNIFCYYYSADYGILNIMGKLGLEKWNEIYQKIFTFLFFFTPFILDIKKLHKACLLGSLMFITFSPGISDQYFILPIALGALDNSVWFIFYSIFTTLYFLGSGAQFNIQLFKIFSNNIIFIISLFWFTSILIYNYKPGKRK